MLQPDRLDSITCSTGSAPTEEIWSAKIHSAGTRLAP